MAEPKERKGKRKRTGRKHSSPTRSAFYAVSGETVQRKAKFCSRCPAGTVLAQHQNRTYCGKCGYTEFFKK